MSIPDPVKTERYLKAVAERRLKDSEKELEHLKTTLGNSEWNKGYLKALEGLLLTLRSNDSRYLYLQKVELEDKTVKRIREEFKRHSTNELHADYDRGYFTALTEYASVLEQTKPWSGQSVTEETASEEQLGEAEPSTD